jgi:hypothetical protein
VVGVAVDFKPVSSPRFPGNWEKNWEFPLIPAIDPFLSPEDPVSQWLAGKFPKRWNWEFSKENREKSIVNREF